MTRYYSKVNNQLLHITYNIYSTMGRDNLTDPSEYLQVAVVNMYKKHVPKHSHPIIHNTNRSYPTQECWIVIDGTVQALLYDIDDCLLADKILRGGDILITLGGEHELNCEHAVMIECKNGPYFKNNTEKYNDIIK